MGLGVDQAVALEHLDGVADRLNAEAEPVRDVAEQQPRPRVDLALQDHPAHLVIGECALRQMLVDDDRVHRGAFRSGGLSAAIGSSFRSRRAADVPTLFPQELLHISWPEPASIGRP